MRESQCAQEAGVVVEGARRELEKSNANIKIEHSNDRPPNQTFAQKVGRTLMKRCDEEAKRKCADCNVKHFRIAAPKIGNRVVDKNMNILIREIDMKHSELEAVKERVREHWHLTDIDARNCFHSGVGAGTLKCTTGCNYHGKRNRTINKGLVNTKCPRCGEEEDWQHVVTCAGIDEMKEACLKEMEKKTRKVAKNNEE